MHLVFCDENALEGGYVFEQRVRVNCMLLWSSRAYAASVNKEKILETLEESQPRLSKAIVDSAPFPVQQGHAKPIPSRSPFPAPEQKTRMR